MICVYVLRVEAIEVLQGDDNTHTHTERERTQWQAHTLKREEKNSASPKCHLAKHASVVPTPPPHPEMMLPWEGARMHIDRRTHTQPCLSAHASCSHFMHRALHTAMHRGFARTLGASGAQRPQGGLLRTSARPRRKPHRARTAARGESAHSAHCKGRTEDAELMAHAGPSDDNVAGLRRPPGALWG